MILRHGAGTDLPRCVVVTHHMRFGNIIKRHKLPNKLPRVAQRRPAIIPRIDAKLNADGVGIGDAVAPPAVAAMPRRFGIFNNLHHTLFVDKIMGTRLPIASAEIAEMSQGIGSRTRIARVVDDNIANLPAPLEDLLK